MESDLRSEISLQNSESLETVNDNISMLSKMIYTRIVNLIRIEVGNIQVLSVKQCYLRLKSVINC